MYPTKSYLTVYAVSNTDVAAALVVLLLLRL